MNKLVKVWLLELGLVIASFIFLSTTATAALANVSHAYQADGQITAGDLVSLNTKKTGYVDAANTSNGAKLLGVAVNAKNSLLAVNPGAETAQVATTGTVNALVSTVNGNIAVGDEISVSPFNGIGMKAAPGLNVIGLAQTNLTSNTPGVGKEEVQNKSGSKSTIWIGYVSLSINVTTDNSSESGTSLNGLQNVVKNLTGHIVSTFRIVVSLIIMAVTLLSLVAVIYSAIYGSIISVGRNPLAKRTIFGTLRAVLLMTLVVAGVASLIILLLLS